MLLSLFGDKLANTLRFEGYAYLMRKHGKEAILPPWTIDEWCAGAVNGLSRDKRYVREVLDTSRADGTPVGETMEEKLGPNHFGFVPRIQLSRCDAMEYAKKKWAAENPDEEEEWL